MIVLHILKIGHKLVKIVSLMYFYMYIYLLKIVLILSMMARRLWKIGHKLARIVLVYEHLCHKDCDYIGNDCASVIEDWL